MGRPRCDPFDAAAVTAAIGKGKRRRYRAYQDHHAERRFRSICEGTSGLAYRTSVGRLSDPLHIARVAQLRAGRGVVKNGFFWQTFARFCPIRSRTMPDELVPASLPTLTEWLSSALGIRLPAIPFAQTAKNLDKAIARIIEAGGANVSSRIDHNTKLRDARTLAEIGIVNTSGVYYAGQIGHNDDISARALMFALSNSVLKQTNREDIARLTIEHVSHEVEAAGSSDALGDIDDDWLNMFSDFSSNKSNNDIKILWSKVLSGKIRQPSSLSLQSLHYLSYVDANDAALIHDVLSYSIRSNEDWFVYKSANRPYLGNFLIAENLGIFTGVSGTLYQGYDLPSFQPQMDPVPLDFHMTGATIRAAMPRIQFRIPCFGLTRFGVELLAMTDDLKRNEEYERDFISFLKESGGSTQRAISGHAGQAPIFEAV
jgi:hypothetical protein